MLAALLMFFGSFSFRAGFLLGLLNILYKGIIYLVAGIIYWKGGWLPAIIALICGVFYILGNFLDKKSNESKAPMV